MEPEKPPVMRRRESNFPPSPTSPSTVKKKKNPRLLSEKLRKQQRERSQTCRKTLQPIHASHDPLLPQEELEDSTPPSDSLPHFPPHSCGSIRGTVVLQCPSLLCCRILYLGAPTLFSPPPVPGSPSGSPLPQSCPRLQATEANNPGSFRQKGINHTLWEEGDRVGAGEPVTEAGNPPQGCSSRKGEHCHHSWAWAPTGTCASSTQSLRNHHNRIRCSCPGL